MSVPFEIPWSIVLDANGNGTFTNNFANDYWYAGTITGETQGSPKWVLKRNGIFFQPSVGSQIVLSCGVMPAGTRLDLIITGGIPNATVDGLLYGAKTSKPNEIPVPLALPNNPTSIVVSSPQKLYPDGTPLTQQGLTKPSFTVAHSTIVTQRFSIPPGTTALRIGANVPNTVFAYALAVQGVQSGQMYFPNTPNLASSAGVNFVNEPIVIPVASEWDSKIDIRVIGDGTNAINVWVSALFDVQAVEVYAQQILNVEQPLPVVWQAPTLTLDVNNGSLANGATMTLLAGIAGQTIYMFFVHIGYDDTNSGITLEDNVSGVIKWRGTYNQNESGLTNSSNFETPMFGAPLQIGSGLILRNSTGAARAIFGTIGVSQG